MKKTIFRFCMLILVVISLNAWVQLFRDYRQLQRRDPELLVMDITKAMTEIDPKLKMARSVQDLPVVYKDGKDNTILCHCRYQPQLHRQ